MSNLLEVTGGHLTEMRVRLEEQAHKMGEAEVAAEMMNRILSRANKTPEGNWMFTEQQYTSLAELRQVIYDAVR